MPLSGHTHELPLADLLQVKSAPRGTSRISIAGPAGQGMIVLDAGRVVHAEYGGLEGLDAAVALLTESDVHYQVRSDVPVRQRTMSLGVTEVLLEAVHRQDEGLVPETRTTPLGEMLGEPRAERAEPRREPDPAESAPRRPVLGDRRPLAFGAAALVAIAVLGFAFVLQSGPEPVADPPGPEPVATETGTAMEPTVREPVDPRELDGPNDRLPTLLAGQPPAVPDPSSALRPTLVCRVLIATDGTVADAEIYRPTPGLEELERRALAAVRSYRFTPAQREGVPVPVWINWPVDFV